MLERNILLAMNEINDVYLLETAEKMGYLEAKRMKIKSKKTFRLLLVAAAVTALLSISAMAFSGWYVETFALVEKPELNSMTQQAIEDASRFTGTESDKTLVSQVASYENGDQGQSGVYSFSTTNAEIGYYETGEISFVDARDHGVQNPNHVGKYVDLYENFFASDEDMAAYVEKLESAAPSILDVLKEDGWIIGSSEENSMVWVNDIYGKDSIFNSTTAVVHVLMEDDTAYELWLNPQTLECEGFMFWKAEDMPNTRNGLFTAMKENNMEQWQYDVSHNPNALG